MYLTTKHQHVYVQSVARELNISNGRGQHSVDASLQYTQLHQITYKTHHIVWQFFSLQPNNQFDIVQ